MSTNRPGDGYSLRSPANAVTPANTHDKNTKARHPGARSAEPELLQRILSPSRICLESSRCRAPAYGIGKGVSCLRESLRCLPIAQTELGRRQTDQPLERLREMALIREPCSESDLHQWRFGPRELPA